MTLQPAPVSIITGFLGSGKTTLLNRLLQKPGLERSLVIINEFGEIGIDHMLVSTPAENMRLLSNGCLCCEVRGDLVETLADAARRRAEGTVPPFDRVIVETTGLADPVPLVRTVVSDGDVAPNFRLDSIITLVDAINAETQLEEHPESVKQVAVADLLLVSKADIAEPDRIEGLEARLREINPGVEIIRAIEGHVEPARLFNRGSVSESATAAQIDRWLGHAAPAACGHAEHGAHCQEHHHPAGPHHGRDIRTFSIAVEQSSTRAAFTLWLSMLASFRGASLLRVKGLVNVEGRPVVVNAVQSVLHEPLELAQWPDEDRRTRLVFIVRDLAREDLERTLEALTMPATAESAGAFDQQAYAQFLRMARSFM